jgi:hypothetical protein
VAEQDVLVHSGQQGCWGWAGFRLTPVLGLEATHQYADLTQIQRAERVADAETAWLSAQWTSQVGGQQNGQPAPFGVGRFEIRYRNDPDSPVPVVRCACLCRVRSADPDPEAVVDKARNYRNGLTIGLPSHVRAEPLADAVEVRDWLVPFESPGEGDSLVDVRKKLSWQRTVRQDTGRNATLIVSRLAARRVSWEPALRELAALPFHAVLTIGFEPFPRWPALRAGLEQLSAQYAMLARPAQGSPLYSVSTPPDPYAAQAAQVYGQAAQQYDGPAFRVRISLAGEQTLPPHLGAWLAAALSDPGPGGDAGAVALSPQPHERSVCWTNLATLGASWLTDTYRGSLPDRAVGPLEREVLTLVDLTEARSLIQLPIEWPGHTPMFAGIVDASPAPDEGWADEPVAAEIFDPALMRRRSGAAGENSGASLG